jgi:hypothetical protein
LRFYERDFSLGFFGEFFCFSFTFSHRTDPFATHQPVLYEVAMHTAGPIIEFGCGKGSTELLHEICKKQGRLLITLDDDENWLKKFTKKYEGDGYTKENSGWHKFYFVPGKGFNNERGQHWIKFLEENEEIQSISFDLCFIDQSPWMARYETLKRFKDKARYVIIHDVDYFPNQKIFGKIITQIDRNGKEIKEFDFSDVFQSFKIYFPLKPWPLLSGPPTLLGSNFVEDLPEIDYNQY